MTPRRPTISSSAARRFWRVRCNEGLAGQPMAFGKDFGKRFGEARSRDRDFGCDARLAARRRMLPDSLRLNAQPAKHRPEMKEIFSKLVIGGVGVRAEAVVRCAAIPDEERCLPAVNDPGEPKAIGIPFAIGFAKSGNEELL